MASILGSGGLFVKNGRMASQNFENQGTSKGKLSSTALHLLKNYDKLVELREQGKTFKEIGQMFGVKRDTVQYIVRKKENKCQSRYPKLPILSDSSEDEMDYDDTIQKVDLVNNIENRQFRTLQSRFYCQAVQRYYAGPITPKIHLTRLFRLSFHQSKENISQSRFVYKCIDCSFSVRKMYFIPIVYLIIDHFLDCKEHLVIENIRKVFLEEREAFKAFLGIHFNHFYKLPKEAELTFHPKKSGSVYRCSIKIPENLIIEAEDESNLTEHDEMEGDNSNNSDDALENIY